MTRRDPIDRFMEFVAPEPNTGCWLWAGGINHNGYGLFTPDTRRSHRRTVRAHRYSYEQHVGVIPDGYDIDHLCRVRSCVNPVHLEPVTRKENIRRGLTGIMAGLRQARKTHCPKGHPYSDSNTYVPPKGGRVCRVCSNERSRKYKARKRAKRPANMAAATIILAALAAFSLPAQAQPACADRDTLLKGLAEKYQESPVHLGITSRGAVLEVLASESGTWTILVTNPMGYTCAVASGESWQDLPRKMKGRPT